MITREKFAKLEEILLYLYGILVFINKDTIRFCAGAVIVVLVLRKILFKEKLECGNENLKKFLLFFVIGGTIWNFFGGMSYKPARNFLKMARYMPIIFYIYPMMKRDKKIVYKFLISCLVGYFLLLGKVILQYKPGNFRTPGFEDINTTGLLGAIVASISMGFAIGEEKIYKKLIFIILSTTGVFITIATKGRGPLISIVVSTFLSLGVYLFLRIELKRIAKFLFIFIIAIPLFYRSIPQKNLARFKNLFNTEQTYSNASNGLRVEMWKNAIWRIKQNPVFGSGTKYDGEKLFDKYVDMMPENTKIEKWYKKQFKEKTKDRSFNDSHCMYLNAIVDNGIFVVILFSIWFLLPCYLVFKYFGKNDEKMLPISLLAGIISFEIQGLFWPIWRKTQQATFWILLALIIVLCLEEKNESYSSSRGNRE